VPFRAPTGIRMVPIDRRSGRRVFGTAPDADANGAIIWEAFRPESEPTRTIRRDVIARRQPEPRIRSDELQQTIQSTVPTTDSEFLQSEGGIY
jgi:penicillin-binding protein 1A